MSTSVLMTDGYKVSMAEAGWPLRRETFYYAHRRGGPGVVPFEVEAELKALLPAPTPEDFAFLAKNQYEPGAAFRAAFERKDLVVRALPKGAAFLDREPVFSVTGASALVSWLEPLLLMWNWRIQLATEALLRPEGLPALLGHLTCARQAELAKQTLDAIGVAAPAIQVDEAGYAERVAARGRELVQIVGDPARIFEVGLRAASCMEQHLIALKALQSVGITRTSNVYGAKVLGMVPVGTMGHEHVQRYGSDDAAFRAMTDRRPQRSSFLLDTFDTLGSGIPAAFALIQERPNEKDSIRYDSGDKEAQYLHAAERAKAMGIRPVQILEDGFDATMTRRFETLREQTGWRPEEQVYGYGGYLVAQPMDTPLTRDRVAAVYKLTQTGQRPTMKFANEAGSGKQSVPGRPVLFRRRAGSLPAGIIGQEGEAPPDGYFLLTGSAPQDAHASLASVSGGTVVLSDATQALVAALKAAAFGGPPK
jgi:nicotinate phosphoribosyltransferase